MVDQKRVNEKYKKGFCCDPKILHKIEGVDIGATHDHQYPAAFDYVTQAAQ